MMPIPFFYTTALSSRVPLVCSSTSSFPTTVATPSIWYKPSPTASTNTDGNNTIGVTVSPAYGGYATFSSSIYSRMWDFSNNGRHLVSTYGFFNYNSTQNSLPFFECTYNPNGIGNVVEAFGGSFSTMPITSGRGTLIVVFNPGTRSGANDVEYNINCGIIDASGYGISIVSTDQYCEDEYLILAAQNSGPLFSQKVNYGTWNISVLSFTGSSTAYANRINGVNGYDNNYTGCIDGVIPGRGLGGGPGIYLDWQSNKFPDLPVGRGMAEIMWWQNPLTDSQCSQVETYLKQKWCIDY